MHCFRLTSFSPVVNHHCAIALLLHYLQPSEGAAMRSDPGSALTGCPAMCASMHAAAAQPTLQLNSLLHWFRGNAPREVAWHDSVVS